MRIIPHIRATNLPKFLKLGVLLAFLIVSICASAQYEMNNIPASYYKFNPSASVMYRKNTAFGADYLSTGSYLPLEQNINLFGVIPMQKKMNSTIIGFGVNLDRLDTIQRNSFDVCLSHYYPLGTGLLSGGAKGRLMRVNSNGKNRSVFDLDLGCAFFVREGFFIGLALRQVLGDIVVIDSDTVRSRQESIVHGYKKYALNKKHVEDPYNYALQVSGLIGTNMENGNFIINATYFFHAFQIGVGYHYTYNYYHLMPVNIGFTFNKKFEITASTNLPVNKSYKDQFGTGYFLTAIFR
ncbi:MAG: hypothetical protein KKA07_02990 [Bacteroidetes bacterium]|nr:hypothetical protein [Bacteroidota bacterium]MBU1718016.1 hypothetical protein [Bacteroidota bacterium]